jgi:hypothetical protein
MSCLIISIKNSSSSSRATVGVALIAVVDVVVMAGLLC